MKKLMFAALAIGIATALQPAAQAQFGSGIQDIEGHLRGGIPERDVDAFCRYWQVCPNLQQVLFKGNRPGYVELAGENPDCLAGDMRVSYPYCHDHRHWY
jgi:hypothetical protein